MNILWSNQGQSQQQAILKNQNSTSRFNILDREERELINQAANLSKEEIWEKLEQKRFNQLKKAAINLQSDMLFHNRCPKCTLLPPCKHYSSVEQIIQEGTQIIQQPTFRQHLSPKKREVIIKTLREQQKVQQMIQQQHLQQSQDYLNQSQASIHSKRGNSKESPLQNKENTQQAPQNNGISLDGNQFFQNQENSNQSPFLTNLDYQSAPHQIGNNHGTNLLPGQNIQTPNKQKFSHRNMFNNTVTGAGGLAAFKNQAVMLQASNLSQYGANIMNQQQIIQKRQYLRKRQGNGGSPTGMEPGQSFFNESKMSKEGPLIPKNLQNQLNNRDRTTVRIRTKNNQYVYAEGSFGQNQGGMLSAKNPGQNLQYSFMENSQQSLYERERLQAVIAKYKEEKIQKQIEKIEQERMQLEIEKKMQKELDIKRRMYIEKQKQKLAEYQSAKDQKDSERAQLDKMERQRWIERERQRREYFESQKKYIAEYREQKRKTDELLMIPQQYQSKNVPNYFPGNQMYAGQQVQNSGIMTKAGQQFISGQGKITNIPTVGRSQYVQENQDINGGVIGVNQAENFNEEDYDDYYGETYPGNDKNQMIPDKRQKNLSTGIIGQKHDGSSGNIDSKQHVLNDADIQHEQINQSSSNQMNPSKRDSLDLLA